MTNIIKLIISFHHMICDKFISHFLSHQLPFTQKVLTFQLVRMRYGAAEKQFYSLQVHHLQLNISSSLILCIPESVSTGTFSFTVSFTFKKSSGNEKSTEMYTNINLPNYILLLHYSVNVLQLIFIHLGCVSLCTT